MDKVDVYLARRVIELRYFIQILYLFYYFGRGGLFSFLQSINQSSSGQTCHLFGKKCPSLPEAGAGARSGRRGLRF